MRLFSCVRKRILSEKSAKLKWDLSLVLARGILRNNLFWNHVWKTRRTLLDEKMFIVSRGLDTFTQALKAVLSIKVIFSNDYTVDYLVGWFQRLVGISKGRTRKKLLWIKKTINFKYVVIRDRSIWSKTDQVKNEPSVEKMSGSLESKVHTCFTIFFFHFFLTSRPHLYRNIEKRRRKKTPVVFYL